MVREDAYSSCRPLMAQSIRAPAPIPMPAPSPAIKAIGSKSCERQLLSGMSQTAWDTNAPNRPRKVVSLSLLAFGCPRGHYLRRADETVHSSNDPLEESRPRCFKCGGCLLLEPPRTTT